MGSEAETEVADVVARINGQQVRVATNANTFACNDGRAPQPDTVCTHTVTTIGSVVPAARPIRLIVPGCDTPVIGARIRRCDVDQARNTVRAR